MVTGVFLPLPDLGALLPLALSLLVYVARYVSWKVGRKLSADERARFLLLQSENDALRLRVVELLAQAQSRSRNSKSSDNNHQS